MEKNYNVRSEYAKRTMPKEYVDIFLSLKKPELEKRYYDILTLREKGFQKYTKNSDFFEIIKKYYQKNSQDGVVVYKIVSQIINLYENIDQNYKYIAEAQLLYNLMTGIKSFEDLTQEEIVSLYCFTNEEYAKYFGFFDIVLNNYKIVKEKIDDAYSKINQVYNFNFKTSVRKLYIDIAERKIEFSEITDEMITLVESRKCEFEEEIKQVYETLDLGRSYKLELEELKKEFDRVNDYINGEEFKNKYKHNFDIIDLYLCSNIQIADITAKYKPNDINIAPLRDLLVKTYTIMRNNLYDAPFNYISCGTLIAQDLKPNFHEIKCLEEMKHPKYSFKPYITSETVNKGVEKLEELNIKYGVPFNEKTLYQCVLSAHFNTDSYYDDVAADHIDILNEVSTINNASSKYLRRRVKKEEM